MNLKYWNKDIPTKSIVFGIRGYGDDDLDNIGVHEQAKMCKCLGCYLFRRGLE